jgi:serine/threonine protein phosphatase PrpC
VCRARHRASGTTATLAIVVGWELLVANVGDSAAYLDTGREVLCLTANHRVQDNAAERARIIAAGGAQQRNNADVSWQPAAASAARAAPLLAPCERCCPCLTSRPTSLCPLPRSL